jgi:glutaminyl-peptide cyclotransferase
MASKRDCRALQCKRNVHCILAVFLILSAFFIAIPVLILTLTPEVRRKTSSNDLIPSVNAQLNISTSDGMADVDVQIRNIVADSVAPFPVFYGDPDLYTYEVVHKFPHDESAFTQGLIFQYPDTLYESTGAVGGPSTLREVDLATGVVRKQVALPKTYFAEGLTFYDDKLLQIFWRNNIGIFYDPMTLKSLGTFQTPLSDGWGITVVDDELVISDSSTELRFLQPKTNDEGPLNLLASKTVQDGGSQIRFANELETVRGEIWANILERDCVMRINPKTGNVVGWINLSRLSHELDPGTLRPGVLNGIAYDATGDRIFLTGKNWANLFEVRLIRDNSTSLDTVRRLCHPAKRLPQYGYP